MGLERQGGVGTRESVKQFADAMEKVLARNDHKDGWEKCTNLYLIQRMIEEASEVLQRLDAGELGDMAEEAIDVANFAMMIYDNNADHIDKEG